MRNLNALLFKLLCLLPLSVMAEVQEVELLRLEPIAKNQTAFHFKLPENSQYTLFTLPSPQRLVVDFSRAKIVAQPIQPSSSIIHLAAIRAAKRGKDSARLVVDLKDSATIAGYSGSTERIDGSRKLTVVLTTAPRSSAPLTVADSGMIQTDAMESPEEDTMPEILEDWDIYGYVGVENLTFWHKGLAPEQHKNYVSGVFQGNFYKQWDDGRQSFAFVPFYRYSQYDNRRTHFDIRELTWVMVEEKWELRTGFRKVFWGVAEGLHLIDIINQTDLVENPDTEDKLGQPMINLALINDWGTVDLFVMPGFRERTFSGVEGRFRLIPQIAVGDALFDRHGLEKHMSYAARWSHYIGNWDIGISHFYGMNREPRFIPSFDSQGRLVKLRPFYETINQTSLDLQMTHESWLWKLEAMVRSGMGKTYFAAVGGLEYTLFDLYETGLDLGFVLEYMYDTRGSRNFYAPFQDDFLTALRFGFNDVQSTEILAGVLFDRTSNSKFYNIEASRRIGDSWKIEAEMRIYAGSPAYDSLYFLRQDDHVRVELSYHF
ncbi:AMIN domain-containing protein [Methylomarinum vadi]|uniref:AMIN domain-containing protein n=1 Tax=Methylomarinum vadi TaxID=438855 RepID=UPI000689A9D2|nr:AMIN domain-containing protein [Methylomarinum vadi]